MIRGVLPAGLSILLGVLGAQRAQAQRAEWDFPFEAWLPLGEARAGSLVAAASQPAGEVVNPATLPSGRWVATAYQRRSGADVRRFGLAAGLGSRRLRLALDLRHSWIEDLASDGLVSQYPELAGLGMTRTGIRVDGAVLIREGVVAGVGMGVAVQDLVGVKTSALAGGAGVLVKVPRLPIHVGASVRQVPIGTPSGGVTRDALPTRMALGIEGSSVVGSWTLTLSPSIEWRPTGDRTAGWRVGAAVARGHLFTVSGGVSVLPIPYSPGSPRERNWAAGFAARVAAVWLELSYVTGGEAGFSALNVGLRAGPRSGGSSSF